MALLSSGLFALLKTKVAAWRRTFKTPATEADHDSLLLAWSTAIIEYLNSNTFSGSDPGLVPTSLSEGKFLRDDGSWQTSVGGTGETNTGSNVGAAGVGTYDSKSLFDLRFRKIDVASNKVTTVLNGQKIDIDVVPSNFTGIPQSGVTNLSSDLALKAPLASPALTGDPTAPTPATSDNDTSIATTAHVHAALAALIPAAGVRGLYGDAVDGNVTIVSGTTTLTRTMYYGDLTIDVGGILECDGYVIYVRGTLTNNGTIRRLAAAGNHGNVSSGSGGTTTTASTRPLGNAANGGTGGIQSGAAGTNASQGVRSTAADGGAGGASNQASYVAGAGGTVAAMSATNGDVRDSISASRGVTISGNGVDTIYGGAGGGGGAGAAASGDGSGGGGGAGGLVMVIVARVIINTSGAIEAKGGAGGNGTGILGAGGGGGGGGGTVFLVSESFTGTAASVIGGIAGSGTGTGVAGSNGAAGNVVGPLRA